MSNPGKFPLGESFLKESEVKGGLRKSLFCKFILQNLLFAYGNLGNSPIGKWVGDFYPVFFGHFNLNI